MRNSGISRRRLLTATASAAASTVLLPGAARAARHESPCRAAYLGSFTWETPPGRGFDVARRSAVSGELDPIGTVDGVPDASWLDFSPDGRTLYTTNELVPDGSVTALDLSRPTAPTIVNTRPSGGAGPTHLSVHPSGRFLLTAHYTDGSIAVHRLRPDGGIGEPTELVRHVGTVRDARAHQVVTDPSGNWVVAVDLGADSVYTYRLDPDTGTLTENQQLKLPDGTGPRHLVFHPEGTHAYLLAELTSTITTLDWRAATGTCTPVDTVGTRPDGAHGENFPAEIVVSADGRFVYASNRGDDTIATFDVGRHKAHPELRDTVATSGSWPRHCTFGPLQHWLYVANQHSGTVTRLPRNHRTGRLGPAAEPVAVPGVAVLAFQ